MNYPAGLYAELSAAEYYADKIRDDVPTLNASTAHKMIELSPHRAWLSHPRLGGQPAEQTEEMLYGAIMHSLVLGVGAELAEIDADDYKTKAAKEARDAARAAGKLPIIAYKAQAARARAEIIREKLARKGLELTGQSEVTVIWEEEGVWSRGRIDHFIESKGLIIDLKMCENAEPRALSRALTSYGSDIQAHAYTSGVSHVRPDLAGRLRFVYAAVEGNEPHIYETEGSFRELGRRRWTRARMRWEHCLRSGEWPSYVGSIAAPDWAIAQEEMATLTGGSSGIPF